MKIIHCSGERLEKSSPTSPEDAFVRSTVKYEADGRERKLEVVYLRCFEDDLSEWAPFEGDPLFAAGTREVHLRDAAAVAALVQDPKMQQRKRLYLHDVKGLANLFERLNVEAFIELFQRLETEGCYLWTSSIPFLKQANAHAE
ncbi:MAG TPA: hypothetical protein VFK44_12665 [Bacillales bacterium]|nr:hypothetical protein [Bacillales bacterium]